MSSSNSLGQPEISARKMLHQAGLRATPARMAVLIVLSEAAYPLSQVEVMEQLGSLAHDQSTVFRNLNDMVRVGLASRNELGDHTWRFELVRSPETHHHPHFVCEVCGSVLCLPAASISLMDTSASFGEVTQILLKGECTDCEKQRNGDHSS